MNKKLLIGAALAGLALTGCSSSSNHGMSDSSTKGQCHGINGCKGSGACGGAGHSCAGLNACKGKGWLKMTKKECSEKGGKFKKS